MDQADLAQHLRLFLMGVISPAWIAAGLADYLCHRFQRIERSAGLKESLLHLLMLAELAVGVLAAVLLEVNAATLSLMLVACLAHEATMCADLAYADGQRRIPWYEQWVHGVQQAVPWMGLGALTLLHADQTGTLLGRAGSADWSWRLKSDPLPMGFTVPFLASAALLVLLPFSLELWRCLQAPGQHRSARSP